MDSRDRRRATAFPLGAVAGAIAGLVVFAAIDLLVPRSFSIWWWVSAAIFGAICGHSISMLVVAAKDDGEDDRGAFREHHGQVGQADAPVEGASARDAGRRTSTRR
jgi:hypothetical protein